MDRNRLTGTSGDRINAILSAVDLNLRKLQRFAAAFLRRLFQQRLLCQRALAYETPVGVGVFKIDYGTFLSVSHVESEVNNITILDNMVSALRLNKPLILGS